MHNFLVINFLCSFLLLGSTLLFYLTNFLLSAALLPLLTRRSVSQMAINSLTTTPTIPLRKVLEAVPI